MTEKGIRLSKLMAQQGICSRREADSYIERGWVSVNGTVIDQLGSRVSPDAEITLAPQAQQKQESRATILLNKPLGYVSCQPEKGYKAAVELLKPENQDPNCKGPPIKREHLFHLAVAGRLDINSKGLLVFTQDGRIARQLIGADTAVEKEYLVRIEGEATEEQLKLLRHGLQLDDRELKVAKIDRLNKQQLRFILKEGRKRQIRRMCEAVDIKVLALKRVRIGKMKMGKLPEGHWRWVTKGETF